jgi:hypothetical protein
MRWLRGCISGKIPVDDEMKWIMYAYEAPVPRRSLHIAAYNYRALRWLFHRFTVTNISLLSHLYRVVTALANMAVKEEMIEMVESAGSGSIPLDKATKSPSPQLPMYSEEEERPPRLLWSRVRHYCREPFSEFFGTMILILFGDGVVAQVVLSNGQKGDYQSISWGWG